MNYGSPITRLSEFWIAHSSSPNIASPSPSLLIGVFHLLYCDTGLLSFLLLLCLLTVSSPSWFRSFPSLRVTNHDAPSRGTRWCSPVLNISCPLWTLTSGSVVSMVMLRRWCCLWSGCVLKPTPPSAQQLVSPVQPPPLPVPLHHMEGGI